MYKQTVDQNLLDNCLAKGEFLEAAQMLVKEMKENFDNSSELKERHQETYNSICVVNSRSDITSMAFYELVWTMRAVLLY